MATNRKAPQSSAVDRQPTGTSPVQNVAQSPCPSWDGHRSAPSLHKPTGPSTTKTGDISPSSQKRYAGDFALHRRVLAELIRDGAKCGTKIAAMLHIEAPRRMMQYLAGQGYVREVSPGDKPKKRMPVWAATAAGLRFVECGPE